MEQISNLSQTLTTIEIYFCQRSFTQSTTQLYNTIHIYKLVNADI